MNRSDIKLYVLSLIVAASILALDLAVPLGVAAGVPYVGLVLVGWWGSSRTMIMALAVLGTILTVIGYLASPEAGIPWMVITNRILAIAAIWTVAIILFRAKKTHRERLRSSEQDYVDLFNNAPIGIVAVTPGGQFVSVNPAFASMLGYDSPEQLMASITDIQKQLYVHPGQRPSVIRKLESNGSVESEYELYRKDGSIIWISETARIVKDDAGNDLRYESFVADITARKNNETALTETKVFLDQSSEMAKIGYWMCEHDTFTYTFWSDGMTGIFERDPTKSGEFFTSSLSLAQTTDGELTFWEKNADSSLSVGADMYHPDDRAYAVDAFNRLVTEGKKIDCEYRVVLPDGRIKWVYDVGIATDFRDGKYHRSFGVTQDITDRKNTENKLEEINAFLSQASEMANAGHWICEHENFTYPYWSEGMDKIFGVVSKNHEGVAEEIPSLGNAGMTHPDDVPRVQECFGKLVTDGGTMDVEYRIVLNNGDIRWIREIGTGTDFKSGKYQRSYGTTQDITSRVHVEQTLREALQFNEAILAGSPVGILIYDDTGQCILANQAVCDIIGATKGGVLTQNYHDIASWKEAGLYDVALECLATGEQKKYEMQATSSFGKEFYVEDHLAPLDVNNKRHLLLMLTDIGEQKKLQTQLIQQSKLATLGEMATGVAHELNQPLNVIRMAAHNVLRKIKKGEVEPAYLNDKVNKIDQQVERATSIIDHMRVFGRRADVKPVPLSSRDMVDAALHLIGEQLRLAGIDVQVDLPEVSDVFLGHQVQVEQVLLNLLGNAHDQLKRCEGAKCITVSVGRDEDNNTVSITIEDTGGGIPEDALPRIFEPFFTTKEIGAGTGLGLSISYGIVTDMGGHIEASNTDHGARFIITLPIYKGDAIT